MADTDYDDSSSELGGGKKQRPSQAGRKLMRWNPDVDQFVLLAVDIACMEAGTPVPWNAVAEKLNGFTTGEGIKQHLAKVRKYRIENDREVPGKGSRRASRLLASPQRTPKRKGQGRMRPATGKGASLLWNDSRQANAREQRSEPKQVIKQEFDEPKPKSGRKKTEFTQTMLATPETPARRSRQPTIKQKENGAEKNLGKKKSTGKRSRAKKELVVKQEDDDDEYYANESPTKKQRSLRATYEVNYDETQHADEWDDDVFDAGPQDQDDEDYDDEYYGSQPGTANQSGHASSHSSHKGPTTPVQPPPNFDNKLHSRTGMHSYGEDYMSSGGSGQARNYGVFTGLNNTYGPPDYGSEQQGHNAMAEQSSQYHRPTADQLQMQGHHTGFGGFGGGDGDEQAYGSREDAAPARKSRKKASHEQDDEYSVTPIGKKNKKKSDESAAKQAKKDRARRKERKDSVHDGDFINGEQQEQSDHNNGYNYFTEETCGNIPIMNDTGRGIHQAYHHQSMPNLSYPSSTFEHQQQHAPTLAPSPTDLDYAFRGGLPSLSTGMAPYQNHNSNTGITPQFNNFSFCEPSTNNLDFGRHAHDFNGSFGGINPFDTGSSGTNSFNSSFSSSDGAVMSQGDQTLPSMGAGLGLGVPWLQGDSGMGMGMDMGGDGDEDNDGIFSLTNHEDFH